MIEFLRVSSYVLFIYYAATNLVYLVLMISSISAMIAQHRRLATLWLDWLRNSSLAPPISILVPARNEEKSVVESVKSYLALDYPELEVVVVNDGSTDGTMEALRREFGLIRTEILYDPEIATNPVHGVYMSARERRLLVLDKESCGRKADALNAALNVASSPFVCAVDADAILENDALLRVMTRALTDPRRVVASGGIIRIVNGSTVERGSVRRVKLPRGILEVLQVVEYLRAFLIGRQGWANFGMLTIISGAFGVFRRDLCRQIGGFRSSAIGEDMDLIVRMHRHLREKKEDYRIAFVPDPVCWTEAPSSLRALASQRARWQNGLADVLWKNRDMVLNPRYGRIGLIALPYQCLFEYLAPVVELVGWTSMILAAILGVLSPTFFIEFLLFGYLFGTMISIGAVVIEEMTYHRYNDAKDLLRLIVVCFLEHMPYRPLHSIWRLQGMWHSVTGRNTWAPMEKVGFAKKAEASVAAGSALGS